MNKNWLPLSLVFFAGLLFFFSSVFLISEGNSGILLFLGRLVEEKSTATVKVLHPGLHFKWPFVEQVRVFDTRLQTLDSKSSRIVTKEKKDVIVDYYVKWRVVDLARYYKSTGGIEYKAQTLLEQQLNTALRAQIGKRTIAELVSGGRDDIMALLREGAEKQAGDLGIHVVDVRIKGVDLPENTSHAIYQRMRADMQKIANKHRADGQAQAESIQAAADAQVTILLAQAQSQGEQIRAAGQAKAAKIYAQIFGQNNAFFAFYRSLKAYEASFNNPGALLVLDQSGAFFDYFKGQSPFKAEVKH